MTSRVGRDWSRYLNKNDVYLNNRDQCSTYDADGRVTIKRQKAGEYCTDHDTYKYDARGATHEYLPNYGSSRTQSWADASGRVLKEKTRCGMKPDKDGSARKPATM